MKRQTAVEWLSEKILESPKDKLHWSLLLNMAKEMERDQIIDAYRADVYPCSKEDAEDYYNNTYKK